MDGVFPELGGVEYEWMYYRSGRMCFYYNRVTFKILLFFFLLLLFFFKKKWQDILLRNCKKTEGVVKGRKKSLQDSKFATMNPSRDGKMTVNVFKSQYYPLHAISRHDFEIYTL